MEPRICFLDIETAPSLGWVWQKYETDVIEFERDWYLLTFAVKWVGETKVKVYGLPDYKAFKRDVEDDKQLVKELWKVLDTADIVIAHNGDRFDMLKANSRFINYRLRPPSFYKTIDTLKVARRKFQFDSNKLDDLGKYLGVGRKKVHTGFHLWKQCMLGNRKAFRKMKDYNAQDIRLLERVYLAMRPWIENHPNINLYDEVPNACPACGSDKLGRQGHKFTQAGRKQQYLCKKCGHWCFGKLEVIKRMLK